MAVLWVPGEPRSPNFTRVVGGGGGQCLLQIKKESDCRCSLQGVTLEPQSKVSLRKSSACSERAGPRAWVRRPSHNLPLTLGFN